MEEQSLYSIGDSIDSLKNGSLATTMNYLFCDFRPEYTFASTDADVG